MTQARIIGNGGQTSSRKVVTDRGVSESLGSLNKNANKHSNWYDSINDFFGKGVDDIDFRSRDVDDTGRVKVTKYDILMGRSQPELQLEYEKQRRRQLNVSDAGQAHFNLHGAEPYSLDTTLDFKPNRGSYRQNESSLASAVTTEETRREDTKKGLETLSKLEVNAEGLVKKAELLAQLKANPQLSVSEINDALATLSKYNPDTITTRATATAGLENTRQSTASMKAADALALRTELNNTAIQMAEIDFKNKTNEYNWRTANADRDYQWRSDEADRDLKATLTQLGYEDKRDERALSREDRRAENRQLMLLQLMKGLGNLGGAMAF